MSSPSPDLSSSSDSASKTTPRSHNPSASAFLVAAGILLSRISGFAREWFFARYFGNSDVAGIFRAAQSIPNFLQNLLGEGVLSASFIPVYSRLLAEGNEADARKVAGAVASLLGAVVSVLVLIGIGLAPVLTKLIVPGFTGPHYDLAVQLVRIVFPGTGILVMSAWCLGVLNSHRQFFLSYSVQVVMNATVIVTLVVFRHQPGETLVVYTTWGATLGSFLIFLVQLPKVLGLLKRFEPSFDVRFAPVWKVIQNFLPVVAGRGVVQISAYVDRILASFISPTALAVLANAQIVYMLPVSLFGMSFSAAELPEMSSTLGTSEEIAEQIRQRLIATLRHVAFYVIPSAVAFWVLGDVVVGALFQNGRFQRGDTVLVWCTLAGLTIGLLAATMGRLYSSTFYALHETKIPLKCSIARVGITAVLGYGLALEVPHLLGLKPFWGIVGLTISSGVASWVEYLLLRWILRRRIGSFRLPWRFGLTLWAIAGSAAVLGIAIKSVLMWLPPFVLAGVVLGIYGVAYLAGTIWLGIPEADFLRTKLLGRLKRFLR